MRARNDPAVELAGRMVEVLESQRLLGTGSYPLTLRRLVELTAPTAAPATVFKAVKKHPFAERVLVARARNLDAPLALADDAVALASSPLLLQFLLEATCSPARPTSGIGPLKKK